MGVSGFLQECCELGTWSDPRFVVLATGDPVHGLYGVYLAWCQVAGVRALTPRRFITAVLCQHPDARVDAYTHRASVKCADGRRRLVRRIYGVQLQASLRRINFMVDSPMVDA